MYMWIACGHFNIEIFHMGHKDIKGATYGFFVIQASTINKRMCL